VACRITVLGSGTIIPSVKRKSTALIFEAGEEIVLFDCGPSVPEAIVRDGFSLKDLDRIFITHFHPDHTLGLGHLFAAISNTPTFPERKRIYLYGPKGIKEFLREWYNLYPSMQKASRFFEVRELDVIDSIMCLDLLVTVGMAKHGSGKALMYRMDYKNSTFVYTGDTAYTEALVKFAGGVDVLVAECSFPDNSPAAGHMTPSEVGLLASRCGAKKLLLVHMYPSQRKKDMEGSIRNNYKGKIIIGSDGMRLGVC
jgi:ribonuclease BN (tRNA processing enzyme)